MVSFKEGKALSEITDHRSGSRDKMQTDNSKNKVGY